MSAPASMVASRMKPHSQSSVLIRGARTLLRLELRRLERHIDPVHFDLTLSAQIDRVRAVLEVLQ